MAFTIYKSGQGYWTRMLSAVGAGVLVLTGVAWLWNQLAFLGSDYRLYIQGGVTVALIVGFGLLVFYLLNKPRIADFMIATESEMRKVNWPSWREIRGSTWIVICGTFLLALLMFVVDVAFAYVFQAAGVLEG